jgi:RNA polymerase sigma-70 factor (ECF subfamily)
MDETRRNPHRLPESLFRREAARLIAHLTRVFGTENLQLAEDVVQDTLFQAMETWKFAGAPDNPPAWLYRVAKNKAIDALRRQRHSLRLDPADPDPTPLRSECPPGTPGEASWNEAPVADDLLGMMFACCHPALAPESQVALILKTLCGFGTAEIAAAFLTSEDTVSKRLYRAKEFFRNERIRPEIPRDGELAARLEPVLAAIYLVFNEGYRTARDAQPIRADLMAEALALGRLLADSSRTADPRVSALMALMCFQAARQDGRLAADGTLVLLADQDRSRWDRRLIAMGMGHFASAAAGDAPSGYHWEAAIAFEHCSAPSYAETRWDRIVGYYDALCAQGPHPTAELNRIAALLEASGPDAADVELDRVAARFACGGLALYHALRGEIRARQGDLAGARRAYAAAMEKSLSEAERAALRAKAEKL